MTYTPTTLLYEAGYNVIDANLIPAQDGTTRGIAQEASRLGDDVPDDALLAAVDHSVGVGVRADGCMGVFGVEVPREGRVAHRVEGPQRVDRHRPHGDADVGVPLLEVVVQPRRHRPSAS